MTEGALEDILMVANLGLVGWISLIGVICLLYISPGSSWCKPLWISGGSALIAYVAACIFLKSIGSAIFLILDLPFVAIWFALVGLVYWAKKQKNWLVWPGVLLLGLLSLTFALIASKVVRNILSDLSPRYEYNEIFGEFPSDDVHGLRGVRDITFLAFSKIILKFRADQTTFDRLKPKTLRQISYEQFQSMYQGPLSGGLLANSVRSGNMYSAAGDKDIAAWCQRFNTPGEEIWFLPRNPSDTEILMTYNPASGQIEYYFFETE